MGLGKALKAIGSSLTGGFSDLVGAGIGAGASILSAKENAKAQREANATNLQIARENNEAQAAMQRENNEFNRQQAIDMFNMENAYNDPLAQKERLENAGFNPLNVLGESGSMAVGQVDTPQSAAAGITPSMASMQPVPSVFGTLLGNWEQISKIYENFSKAGVNAATKQDILGKLEPTIRLIQNQTIREQAQSNLTNFQQFAAQAKLPHELNKLVGDFFNAVAAGNANEAEAALKKVEKQGLQIKNNQARESWPMQFEQLRQTLDLTKAQVKTEQGKPAVQMSEILSNNASASADNAQADFVSEQARQLKDMRDDILAIRKLEREGQHLEVSKLRNTLGHQIAIIKANRLCSEREAGYYEQMLRKATFDNDARVYHEVLDFLERVNDGANKWAPWALSREDHGTETRTSWFNGEGVRFENRSYSRYY